MHRFTPKTILITDCNRGLGIQLVNMLSNKFKESSVLASGDKIDRCRELIIMKESCKNIHTFDMDIESEMSVYKAENEMDIFLKKDGLNLLINNMLYGGSDFNDFIPITGSTETFIDRSMLDVVGPHIVAKVFIPHLITAARDSKIHTKSFEKEEISDIKSMIINIANFRYPKNSLKGLSQSYRIGRNFLNKSILSTTSKLGIVACSLFPLNDQINRSNFTIARDILPFIENANSSYHGKFFDWSGSPLPMEEMQ